jgi:glycosyltransferase involved in cell wall biosynthesis/GT2 family glycosyltransferase
MKFWFEAAGKIRCRNKALRQEYYVTARYEKAVTSGDKGLSSKRKSAEKEEPSTNRYSEQNPPPVSIIIPTVNRNDILSQTMKYIGNLKYTKERLEVILVNNGESPLKEDFSALLPYPLKYVKEEKQGRARARNCGIRQAEGEWVLFLDDDVLPDENLLMEHILLHFKHPGSVVLGEVLPCPGTSILDAIHLVESFWGQAHEDVLEYGTITCNLSLRRSDIFTAGLFDESFDLYGFEDLEFGYRLIRRAGLKLRYNKRARGWHYKLLGRNEAITNYFQAGISFTRFLKKHPAALMDSSSPRIAGHLRQTLQRAINFKPLDAIERDDNLRILSSLEKAYRESPDEENERNLAEKYRGLLDYTFIEGTFLALRGLAGDRPPLLIDDARSTSPPHRKLSIYSTGLFSQHSGFGSLARATVDCMRGLGHLVQEEDIENARELPDRSSLFPYHLFVHQHWEPAPLCPTGPYKIQVTACETSLIPEKWIEPYNRMDEIWVPSHFCRDALIDSGVRRPISVIPYGIDCRKLKPKRLGRSHFSEELFSFLSLGEFWDSKGFDLLIKAYYEEFNRFDEVMLILKVTIVPRIAGIARQDRMGRFIQSIRKDIKKKRFPPLFIYYDDIPADSYADFINSCDVYVCASRGEGFCIPILEAMSLGKIIISTAFGGQMDYLSENNSYLVDYEPVAASSPPYHRQGKWAAPSIGHLRQQMRRVYENRDEARVKASKGKNDALYGWNLAKTREKMSRRIDEIYSDHGWRGERIFRGRKALP